MLKAVSRGSTSSGTFTSKPSSPSAGQLYFATDLNILILYDGTKWKPTGGSGVIYSSGVQTTLHTGDTTETNVNIVSIPAGLLSANGGLRITAQAVKVGANGNGTWNTYLSATSGGTNGTKLITETTSAITKLAESLIRTIWNRNNQALQVTQTTTNFGTGESSLASATSAINMANAAYLNFTVTLANTADSIGYDAITVEWLEP